MAKSKSFRFMALLLFSLVFSFGLNDMVNGGNTKLDPTSIWKTIVAGDEIIDCVDIYKQPAFNHPLLKNHTLQLKPSSYPTGSKSKVSVNSTNHIQLMWHRNGEYCPEGTVPIVRSSTTDIPPKNKYDRLTTFSNTNGNRRVPILEDFPRPEVAAVYQQGLYFYGLNADMSAWNPNVEANELSSSQVWVSHGEGRKMEAIEAGWMVTPEKPHPLIFTHWTVDGYRESGCYNLDCSGFIETTNKYGVGSELQPISTYNGVQNSINLKIYKDFGTGNWWLQIQELDVGYWPAELFYNMKTSATKLAWGGRVTNTDPKGVHTTTQMGSGHLPGEGYGRAAWFEHLEYVDANGYFSHATDVESHATRPECYDVEMQMWDKDARTHFLYGGPGYSPACK